MTAHALPRATFAGGCFWQVEYRFGQHPGVVETAAGYMGGFVEAPSYKQVCTDRTGHAEVVQLAYDPAVTDYEALLRLFFTLHDPTTRNRQGQDVGTQYRSAVFVHDAAQEALARRVRQELNEGPFAGRIVTEIVPATTFWRAEDYHQQYNLKHPELACAL